MSTCKDCKKKDVRINNLVVEIRTLTSSFEDSLPSSQEEITFSEMIFILRDYIEAINEILIIKK